MAADPGIGVTALAVDLVPEYDGDTAYVDAVLDVAAATDRPLVVLAGLPAAVDDAAAARLRAAGVPVLEGFRSGLLAVRNLLGADRDPPPLDTVVDDARRARWCGRLRGEEPLEAAEVAALLADYGVPTPAVRAAGVGRGGRDRGW